MMESMEKTIEMVGKKEMLISLSKAFRITRDLCQGAGKTALKIKAKLNMIYN